MEKIKVFCGKDKEKNINKFSKLYCEVINNSKFFTADENSEIHKEFLELIARYAIKFYKVNFTELEFEKSDKIYEASSYDQNVVLPTALLTCNNFEEFLFESILNIFHEVNHIFIDKIEENFVKGLNGQTNLNMSIKGAQAIIEYFKNRKIGQEKIDLLKELIYLNSINEKRAFYSSAKLGLRFISEIKNKLSETSENIDILNNIEKRLNEEYERYVKSINNAISKRKNLINKIFLDKILYELEEETIYELLSNKKITDEKYSAFLTAIEIGIYDEKTIENYKKAILKNEMGIEKIKLFCDLITIPTYKINENDLIEAIKLICADPLIKKFNKTEQLSNLKICLKNIDDQLIDKTYEKIKGEKNERLS